MEMNNGLDKAFDQLEPSCPHEIYKGKSLFSAISFTTIGYKG